MESQPQNPEFRINPESFHPCSCVGVIPSHPVPVITVSGVVMLG